MLFNSYEFIFVFLPSVLIIYLGVQRVAGQRLALRWLALASLWFYWWLGGAHVFVLLFSILVNYGLGHLACRFELGTRLRSLVFGTAIMTNLLLLGYFKYLGFILDNIDLLLGTTAHIQPALLPIGISFFTFQQIAYQVDLNAGQTRPAAFWDYLLFVSFFAHVTAGPIVRPDLLPFYTGDRQSQPLEVRFFPAITLFSIGLFKKVVIADNLATYADQVFAQAALGSAVGFSDAWLAGTIYTLQLYFDFSGYSDMAIAIGMFFGIELPLNFNSPYKAQSIIEFWQRWHMSLTRFLTTYLYLPMAMSLSRRSAAAGHTGVTRFAAKVIVPTLITFFLAGIWHGAGWTYILFGMLHGIALSINNAWRAYGRRRIPAPVSWALTALVVLVGMILFRASDVPAAATMLAGLSGMAGSSNPLLNDYKLAAITICLLAIVLTAPNSQEIVGRIASTTGRQQPLRVWDIVARVGFATVVFWIAVMWITPEARFLYYQY